MWKKIVVTAGIVVFASVAVAIAFRSGRGSYRLERSTTIAAPLEAVQARVADLQQWTTWSPWEPTSADFDRKFEGPASGAGATYSWTGGEDVGAGRLTVVSASAEEVRVESQIDRPRRRTSAFQFRLERSGNGTRITWTATCEGDRARSLRELFTGPLAASAADLENGLAKLKSAAEAAAAIETYRVERSVAISAPPDAVQRQLVDLRSWTDWLPREALDRSMREQVAGRALSAGSTYNWSGNEAVGAGRVTLMAADPRKVEFEINVTRPAQSLSDHEFTLSPEGSGTRLTWTATGEKDSAGKAFGLYAIPLDELPDDMEKALVGLKAVVEAGTKLSRK